jgi:hypothetical protein
MVRLVVVAAGPAEVREAVDLAMGCLAARAADRDLVLPAAMVAMSLAAVAGIRRTGRAGSAAMADSLSSSNAPWRRFDCAG